MEIYFRYFVLAELQLAAESVGLFEYKWGVSKPLETEINISYFLTVIRIGYGFCNVEPGLGRIRLTGAII